MFCITFVSMPIFLFLSFLYFCVLFPALSASDDVKTVWKSRGCMDGVLIPGWQSSFSNAWTHHWAENQKKKKSPHLLFNSHFNEKRGKKTPRNAGFLHKKRVKQLMWKNESKMYAYTLLCAVLYTYFFSSWLQNDNISDKYEFKIK